MAEALLTRHTVEVVLGRPRLLRFIRAGWLAPAQRTPSRVLFRVADVHAALRRLERGEALPPDQIESARTNGSARRHGRGYVKKVRPISLPQVWEISRPTLPDLVINLDQLV
jgi:hypothetical protein